MSELKPCPFCGGEKGMPQLEQLREDSGGGWRILCYGCMASVGNRTEKTYAEVIEVWNTRTSGWVSVEYRLPERFSLVLVAQNTGAVFMSSWQGDCEWESNNGFLHSDVTHWQPLPDPPEDDCND